ncbi:E3 ubiquitin-protein ligase HECTD3 [Platysternon megacephalum]|uniref:E3 ubiquitin-protein ligase HECTD3 n=1 Tax=Platysternon megacephalum TaxID=55544 RepID=A0A4D9DXX4_9SAUR|nr:E3 ubiquitin-protein ligase HECTD3 [Platysternon megacephalum]
MGKVVICRGALKSRWRVPVTLPYAHSNPDPRSLLTQPWHAAGPQCNTQHLIRQLRGPPTSLPIKWAQLLLDSKEQQQRLPLQPPHPPPPSTMSITTRKTKPPRSAPPARTPQNSQVGFLQL